MFWIYFDYTVGNQHSPENVVSSLLGQAIIALNLSDGPGVPSEIFECLAKIKSKRRQPDLTGTLKLLSKALQKLRKTYICIDALDECKADYVVSILRALKSLLDDPNLTTSLSVFITSRPHVDPLIKAHLTNRAPASRLSVTIKANANDIEKYLIDKIESDTSHVDMDSDLENDIVANITSTADGMLVPTFKFQ